MRTVTEIGVDLRSYIRFAREDCIARLDKICAATGEGWSASALERHPSIREDLRKHRCRLAGGDGKHGPNPMLTGETLFDLPGNVSTVNYVSADNWDAPCLMKFVAPITMETCGGR
jgi:hypothetical protein